MHKKCEEARSSYGHRISPLGIGIHFPQWKKKKSLKQEKKRKISFGSVHQINFVMSGESGSIIKKCCVAVVFVRQLMYQLRQVRI